MPTAERSRPKKATCGKWPIVPYYRPYTPTPSRPIAGPIFDLTLSRRGSQKGGGGGGSYRNFRSGSKLLQGSGQINKQKLQTAVGGGGPMTPQKTLYPRMLSLIEDHRMVPSVSPECKLLIPYLLMKIIAWFLALVLSVNC